MLAREVAQNLVDKGFSHNEISRVLKANGVSCCQTTISRLIGDETVNPRERLAVGLNYILEKHQRGEIQPRKAAQR